MTLLELKHEIEKILKEHPRAKNARILVDTEARRFNAHMIELERFYYDPEYVDSMGGEEFCYFIPDYKGTEL